MPKQLEEINQFVTGIVSSPSTIDAPKEAATFSLNIDGNLEQGALKGIKSDRILTTSGFVDKRRTSFKLGFNTSGTQTWSEFMGYLSGETDSNLPKWFVMHTYFGPVLIWFSSDDASLFKNVSNTTSFVWEVYLTEAYPGITEKKVSISQATTPYVFRVLKFGSMLANWKHEGTSLHDNVNEYALNVSTSFNDFPNDGDLSSGLDFNLDNYPNDNSLAQENYSFTWKIESNYLGEIPYPNWSSGHQGALSNTGNNATTNVTFSEPLSGSGSTFFTGIKWADILDRDEGQSLLILKESGTFGVVHNIYTNASEFDPFIGSAASSSPHLITSEHRNNNVYIGLGNKPWTIPKWYGKINRTQLNRELNGDYIEDSECIPPVHLNNAYGFDHLVVPTLNYNMNSTNGMIAGSASLYGASAVGSSFGGDDVEADGTTGGAFNSYRSLNGWIMKGLANAGQAWQSNGTSASTDDGTFNWPASVKRGMVFRVAIGPEASSGSNVARDLGGTIAPGTALFELRNIKQIGYGNNDSLAKRELHDGDLFQVVTVPASGDDSLAHSTGDAVTFPRLMYIGSLSGTSTAHASTNAFVPAPAWAYGMTNDDTVISRISLSPASDEEFDINLVGDDKEYYVYSSQGATSKNVDFVSYNKRITSIDLADYITDENFTIGTIAECMSTDGEGGIAGRTNKVEPHTIASTTADASISTFTISSGHGYITGDWITIAGAHADYNGTHQITGCTATTVVISSQSTETPSAGTITSLSRNHYAAHGKLWVTSGNAQNWDKVYLLDVVNWHGLDGDSPKITIKEFRLNYDRIHPNLISGDLNQGLIEENAFDKNWVDTDWTPHPNGCYISSICETYSCRPHLDDGAYNESGKGRWRVWFSFSKISSSPFQRWELFLYNARPTDICDIGTGVSDKFYMYDKTPPYQEVWQLGLQNTTTNPAFLSRDKMLFSGSTITLNDRFGNYLEYRTPGANTQSQYTTDEQSHIDAGWNEWSDSSGNQYKSPADVLNPGDVYPSRGRHLRSPGTHFLLRDANHDNWDTNSGYGKPAHGSMASPSFGGSSFSAAGSGGGPMFRDPGGYWHVIEMGLFSGVGNANGGNDAMSALKALNLPLHLGWNVGWHKDNPRNIVPTRHCLKPYYCEWYNTTGIAVEDLTPECDTDADVAHIVTLAANQSGRFIVDAGRIQPKQSGSLGNNLYPYAWKSNGNTNRFRDYDNVVVLLHQHDSLVAFTSSDAFGNLGGENDGISDLDGVTDWSGSGGTGIDEVQARPSGATDATAAHTDGTGDRRADHRTDNGVQATLGYSKFNQYRYGHDNNGTHDLETDDYTSAVEGTWNTWTSYKGADGYGHYNMVTVSMNSIGEIGADRTSSYATPNADGTGRNGYRRMRNFNTYWNYDTDIYPDYHINGEQQIDVSGSKGHYYGGEGTGYLTWYANHTSMMGSANTNGQATDEDSEDTGSDIDETNWNGNERGYYDDGVFTTQDTAINTAIADGTYTVPVGSGYTNRRIVMCNSVVSKECGRATQNHYYSNTKAPRSSFQTVDGYVSNYTPAGRDERNKLEKIRSMDNIYLYETDDSTMDKITSAFLIQGIAEDNNDEHRTMVIVGSPSNGYSSLVGVPPYKNMRHQQTPLRPFKQSNSESARRFYNNSRLIIKNMCHGMLSDSGTHGVLNDIYSPIIVGDSKDNTSSQLSTWRREKFPIMGTSLETIAYPHYDFDMFFNSQGEDAAAYSGLDNCGQSDFNYRYPTETTGSTVGYNDNDANNASSSYTDPGVHRKIFRTSAVDTVANPGSNGDFAEGDILEYKFSYLYDGFQDSALTRFSHFHDGGDALAGSIESISFTILISQAEKLELSTRVTDILIWRRNNSDDDFRLVAQANLEQVSKTPQNDDGEYTFSFKDDTTGESYLSITGVNQTLRDLSVNYGLSTQVGDYLFVGNTYHPRINDAENIVFRSQPSRFSIFDWSLANIIAMPSKPLSLNGFAGKLYVFSRDSLYKVNPDDMYIESRMDGIGVIDQRAVVVTDFGMFFCDANGMYHHDGTSPKTISGTVMFNQDYPEGNVGYKEALKKSISEGYSPHVLYDGKNKCVYFIIRGYSESLSDYSKSVSRAYVYSIESGRFDYIETEIASTTLNGRDGESILVDSYQIYELRTSSNNSRTWKWNSKEFAMGSLAVDKSFKTIKFAGSPNFDTMNFSTEDDVRVYVDGVQKDLILQNRNYSVSKTIASATPKQNWTSSSDYTKSEVVYGIKKSLPGFGETNSAMTNKDAFELDTETMPEFISGVETDQDTPSKEGDLNTLKYISKGQYLMFYVEHLVSKRKIKEIVKVSDIKFYWRSDNFIDRVEVVCERAQLGTASYSFEEVCQSNSNWNHAPLSYVGPSFKFPSGTKGKSLQVKLQNQEGTIDSLSIVYRNRVLK